MGSEGCHDRRNLGPRHACDSLREATRRAVAFLRLRHRQGLARTTSVVVTAPALGTGLHCRKLWRPRGVPSG